MTRFTVRPSMRMARPATNIHVAALADGSNWLNMRIYRNTGGATSNVFTVVFIFAVNNRVEKQQSFLAHE
jgi:hypothetical protein